jgi:hypothetical protein
MSIFSVVLSLTLLGGAAGGLANYLSAPPAIGETRSFLAGVRHVIVGAITALVVPLFLTLLQSALVEKLLLHSDAAPHYGDILVYLGFSVLAGFTSRRFVDSVAARLLRAEKDAADAREKAGVATEEAREAKELSEEGVDLAIAKAEAVAARVARPGDSQGSEVQSTPLGPVGGGNQQEADPRASALATSLNPTELEVLRALGKRTMRTLTGVAHDARVSRNAVGELIDFLQERGLVRLTASTNTGGARWQLTELGVQTVNAWVSSSQTHSTEVPPG